MTQSRRRFLTAVSTGLLGAAAGCNTSDSTTSQTTDRRTTTSGSTSTDRTTTTRRNTTDNPEATTEQTTQDTTEEPNTTEETTTTGPTTSFEELYSNADRLSIPADIDWNQLEQELEQAETQTEKAALAATTASWKNENGHYTTEAIRYLIDDLQENELIEGQVFADQRTAYSGGEVPITEMYVEENNGEFKKVMVGYMPNNAEKEDREGYNLIAGEQPVDGGPTTDENLYKISHPDATASINPIDFENLENRIDEFRGSISEDEWNSAWNGWWENFNSYLLESDENLLAPTENAWRYIGENERIMHDTHNVAFENWKNVNLDVANRQLTSDQYLEIDYNGNELEFGVVDEYNPAELMERPN